MRVSIHRPIQRQEFYLAQTRVYYQRVSYLLAYYPKNLQTIWDISDESYRPQEEASPAIEALKVVGDPLGKMAATLVEVC